MYKSIFISLFIISNLFSFEHLNENNFDEKIKKGNSVVKFYATWCDICKGTSRNLSQYKIDKPKNISIYRVDIGEEVYLTKKYDATTIPLFIYFKDGKEIGREDAIKTTEQIKDSINKYFQ